MSRKKSKRYHRPGRQDEKKQMDAVAPGDEAKKRKMTLSLRAMSRKKGKQSYRPGRRQKMSFFL
jgi:hypothetical protein